MEIRPARPDDWPQIYTFFRAIVDEGRTYAYPSGLLEDEARPLWMENPPGLTVVALEGNQIVGSAKMGPNRPGRGSHVATASFMVDHNFQRRGIASALATFVIDWSRAQGYRALQFNAVVASNTAALTLWQRMGFSIVGTVPEAFLHPDDGYVALHIMYLPLS